MKNKLLKILLFNLLILLMVNEILFSGYEPEQGLRDRTPSLIAITGATVHPEPGVIWESATIVIQDELIIAAGAELEPPPGARIIDHSGKHIYAGFIDMYVPVDVNLGEQSLANPHWNKRIHPDWKPTLTDLSSSKRKRLQKSGFTVAQLVPDKGIFRGEGRVTAITDQVQKDFLTPASVVQCFTPEHGGEDDEDYPNSLLGALALIRQTFYDAQWYQDARDIYTAYPESNRPPEVNTAFETLAQHLKNNFPLMAVTKNELDAITAIEQAKEFDLNLWLLGSGYEYRRLSRIAAASSLVITPINFPESPSLESRSGSLEVTLRDLRHWDRAPENPLRLIEAGVPIVLTSYGHNSTTDFRHNLQLTISRGVLDTQALRALTTGPARHLGLEQQLGTITAGKLAFLTVANGDYFKGARIHSIWQAGNETAIDNTPEPPVLGTWKMPGIKFSDPLTIKLKKSRGNYEGDIYQNNSKVELMGVDYVAPRLTMSFASDSLSLNLPGICQIECWVTADQCKGTLVDGGGDEYPVTLKLLEAKSTSKYSTPSGRGSVSHLSDRFPDGAFGWEEIPTAPQTVVFQNAQVWTCSDQGILPESDVIIRDGYIIEIGSNLALPPYAQVIDASGMHLTPGIIDCHSHTAERAVNEGSQAITSEVRIADVIDPDDIAIYRELAGGVTTMHLLHGSANPIGGQDAVLKLKWGEVAADMIYDPAPPGIKFALGENVKQSNWGEKYTTRYPQTRMGVDQIIRDSFNAAWEYGQRHADYQALGELESKSTIPPRIDLELAALYEVLSRNRMIHCHAYRQDEMLNLVRIAADYNLHLATLDHGLEGYKIGEYLLEHDIGVTSFSDWWAYKFEVYDAIPWNGSLLHQLGVSVSFKSDSDELARRLNLEAAKAVKYGNLDPHEALKLVTINAADQLGITEFTGSIEPGKDADIALWNGNPLSTMSRCEQTWVEGIPRFTRHHDREMLQRDLTERTILIQKVLHSESGDEESQEGQK